MVNYIAGHRDSTIVNKNYNVLIRLVTVPISSFSNLIQLAKFRICIPKRKAIYCKKAVKCFDQAARASVNFVGHRNFR